MPDDRFTLRDAFLRVMLRSKHPELFAALDSNERTATELELARNRNAMTPADRRFLKSLRIAADAE